MQAVKTNELMQIIVALEYHNNVFNELFCDGVSIMQIHALDMRKYRVDLSTNTVGIITNDFEAIYKVSDMTFNFTRKTPIYPGD